MRRGGWGEGGPGFGRARFVRWMVRGMVIAAVWGVMEAVVAGAGWEEEWLCPCPWF